MEGEVGVRLGYSRHDPVGRQLGTGSGDRGSGGVSSGRASRFSSFRDSLWLGAFRLMADDGLARVVRVIRGW